MIISVVLLPNSEDSQALIEYSKRLADRAFTAIQLGADMAIPHITVAQFEVEQDITERLWQSVRSLRSLVTEMSSTGLGLVPGRIRSESWVELLMLKSEALRGLQQDVSESSFCQDYSIKSSYGDTYRPHCTLGLLAGFTIPELDLESSIFNHQYTGLTLAAGINGKNYTFDQIRFT